MDFAEMLDYLLFESVLSSSPLEITLLLLEFGLSWLRRKRRGDAVLDWADVLESESYCCLRFFCAKSINKFTASALKFLYFDCISIYGVVRPHMGI